MDRTSPPATVAVLMATFNRAHLIRESIESLLGQTRPPDEFIIINDGSTDNTADIVQSYGPRIKYLERANGGKSAALNGVLPQVESTYTWIFDDDDVALPNALEAHLKFLSDHPRCDFTFSTNYVFSGGFSEDALKRGKLKTFPAGSDQRYLLWIMESQFLPTLMQGMLVSTECYRAVGGFDEALLRCEDVDMILRLARRFRAGCVPQPTFGERLHQGERGPGFERHADADRYEIFRRYKRPVFGKLRETLPLANYLSTDTSEPAEHHPLSSAETGKALLERAKIMSIHGLYPEAIDDFMQYVDQLDSTSSELSEKDRQSISAMTCVRDPDAVPPAGYYQRLGGLCRGRPELFKAAARGLYWSVTREAGRRRATLVSRLLGLAAVLGIAYLVPGAQRRRGRGVK